MYTFQYNILYLECNYERNVHRINFTFENNFKTNAIIQYEKLSPIDKCFRSFSFSAPLCKVCLSGLLIF